MAQVVHKTITVRYTPAARCCVYDQWNQSMSPTDAMHILKTLNRTKISTQAPKRPKGGEVYVYRAKIIGRSWRIDGYERCWLSNGTHYYPKFNSLDIAKQIAVFRVIRHVAYNKETNEKFKFTRVAYVELAREEKDNPLVIVHYFGDEKACVIPETPARRPSRLSGSSKKTRKRGATPRNQAPNFRHQTQQIVPIVLQNGLLSDNSQCEVIVNHPHHESMDIQDGSSDSAAPVVRDFNSTLDEDLREASAQGDKDRVASLLASGASVNSANRVNGWTALHWAAKRDHPHIVSLLLGAGANPSAKNSAGKLPSEVGGSAKLAKLLNSFNSLAVAGDSSNHGDNQQQNSSTSDGMAAPVSDTVATGSNSFVPNYLRNPEFHYARRTAAASSSSAATVAAATATAASAPVDFVAERRRPLLLLARVANSRDTDFIELELGNRTYANLMEQLCQELGQDQASVERIRKLPNIRLRNDADVGRLEQGQQLELVLRTI